MQRLPKRDSEPEDGGSQNSLMFGTGVGGVVGGIVFIALFICMAWWLLGGRTRALRPEGRTEYVRGMPQRVLARLFARFPHIVHSSTRPSPQEQSLSDEQNLPRYTPPTPVPPYTPKPSPSPSEPTQNVTDNNMPSQPPPAYIPVDRALVR